MPQADRVVDAVSGVVSSREALFNPKDVGEKKQNEGAGGGGGGGASPPVSSRRQTVARAAGYAPVPTRDDDDKGHFEDDSARTRQV
jgi:hypothetical protein